MIEKAKQQTMENTAGSTADARLAEHEVRELLHVRELLFRHIVQGRAETATELKKFLSYCSSYMMQSSAQIFQDLLVTFLLKGKRNGYFVEFGATDGMLFSNTLLLERQFGWTGVLAEPAKSWHQALKQNRKCRIDTRCVWSETGHLIEFTETTRGELSTISTFVDSDHKKRERANVSSKYDVRTVSLNDLLTESNAPPHIDYLSIDTEGSEIEILKTLNFEKYRFSIITVETNNRPDWRDEPISKKGYRRIFPEISLWDAWYIFEP